jgi:hypothetical protein
MKKKNFISAQPNKWHEIHQKLIKFWEMKLDEKTIPPPSALVLSGWTMSNDLDKKQQWKKTIDWAESNGCSDLIHLNEDDKYYVEELSSWRPFEYSNWDETIKERPSGEVIQNYFRVISQNWESILSSEFSENTEPVKFSGKKLRRLIVKYNQGYVPPWGSWDNHLANGAPSKFTELRKNINELIRPHMVDHIDFIVDKNKEL